MDYKAILSNKYMFRKFFAEFVIFFSRKAH